MMQEAKKKTDTKTKTRSPLDNLDDLLNRPQGGDLTAPQGSDPAADRPEQPQGGQPDMPRATGDETRRAASGVSQTDRMRDLLNRMQNIDQDDEIDDREAARRAGLDTDGAEPRPQDTQNLPALVKKDLATMSNQLQAAGTVTPKWHTINNLPGYMSRAIRAMGRGNFRMFTRTALEDIMTLANVNGQGPNSDREIQAVAGWLQKNAENLGPVEIDYSQIMPGYEPEVIEFKTDRTRFHLVRDEFGQYIYAYPETDAVSYSGQDRLTGPDSSEPERDEFGALITPKRIGKESTMENVKFNSISEQIKHYTTLLESLQEQSLEEQQNWELLEALLDESTLSRMIGQTPGGQSLVRYLHRTHRLGNDAEYIEIPERVHASLIKASKDNFAIVIGTSGAAGIKPVEQDWERSNNPERDNTMRYVLVWATESQGAESEIQKFRLGRRDATGGASGMEAGAPNLFQVLRDRIGATQQVYVTRAAVERAKVATREKQKTAADPWEKPPLPGSDREPVPAKKGGGDPMDKIADKLKPILSRLLNQAVGNIGQRVQRLSQAGNFAQAQELTRAGAKIQDMLTALDTDNPDYDNYRSPLRAYMNLIQSSVRKLAAEKPAEERDEFIASLAQGQAKELGDLLNVVRQGLMKIS
jgi:hypothetical protein